MADDMLKLLDQLNIRQTDIVGWSDGGIIGLDLAMHHPERIRCLVTIGANYDLGDGWGINGHVGHLKFKGIINGDYTDWKIGVTKDISGWVIGASYIDTNAKGNCGAATAINPQPYCFSNGDTNAAGTAFDKTRDAGKGVVVISISKTF